MSNRLKHVLIIGQHPMKDDLTAQYSKLGYAIDFSDDYISASDVNRYDELFLFSCEENVDSYTADCMALESLKKLLEQYDPQKNDGRRIRCHILLQDASVLRLLQTSDLNKDYIAKCELIPFTIDEMWAQRLFVSLPGQLRTYPPLDRVPIDYDSNKTVHLVIFGLNDVSESVAMYAALVAHYPNYTKQHRLRTRITFIDEEIGQKASATINKYNHLFDNSFYRFIDLDALQPVTEFHVPQYMTSREEFVDVEWEFVKAGVNSSKLRDKFLQWSADDEQILTIALCQTDDSRNIATAMSLPDCIEQAGIPVLIRTRQATIFDIIARTPKLSNIYPFGMNDRGYDVTLPLHGVAKRINYVYNRCYDDNFASTDNSDTVKAPTQIDMAIAEAQWNKLTMPKRYSCIYNAMTITGKMRALGHNEDDWDTFYSLNKEEIAQLAEVEHNRWSVEELILGFRPVTDDEQKIIENDINKKREYKSKFIHYDLRAYNDLRVDETGKNSNVYDICLSASIPLIANSFTKDNSHG